MIYEDDTYGRFLINFNDGLYTADKDRIVKYLKSTADKESGRNYLIIA
jgi:hypothetical protein